MPGIVEGGIKLRRVEQSDGHVKDRYRSVVVMGRRWAGRGDIDGDGQRRHRSGER